MTTHGLRPHSRHWRRKFGVKIASNTLSRINSGGRYRAGERISSDFVQANDNADQARQVQVA